MRCKFLDCWLFNELCSLHRPVWFEFLYIAVFLVSTWWVGAAQAKEIYIQPSINITTKYDDNIKLRVDRFDAVDKSAYGVITRANAKVGVRSNRYDIALDSQVVINRYSSDFDLDSEDFYVNFSSSFDATEKSRLSLSGNYKQVTTLTSELDENGT
ncbi:MAG: outer membrane beta-barrel protein, partial [Methylococcales bacterium]|nr:outer membrane beta-barrel protein [Methylococcales bacterium]